MVWLDLKREESSTTTTFSKMKIIQKERIWLVWCNGLMFTRRLIDYVCAFEALSLDPHW